VPAVEARCRKGATTDKLRAPFRVEMAIAQHTSRRVVLPTLISLALAAALVDALTTGAATSGSNLPSTYQQACANEVSVCLPNTRGPIPVSLFRPLHFPKLGPDDNCPTSQGALVRMPRFPKVAIGQGPVRPMLLASGNVHRGIADISPSTNAPGWFGIKTNWFSFPSYQGPIVIRAEHLGGPGRIAFSVYPTTTVLVVPPGPTLNRAGRWRDMPGGTYVKSSGCYAWQVDGRGFSVVIVFKAVLSPTNNKG